MDAAIAILLQGSDELRALDVGNCARATEVEFAHALEVRSKIRIRNLVASEHYSGYTFNHGGSRNKVARFLDEVESDDPQLDGIRSHLNNTMTTKVIMEYDLFKEYDRKMKEREEGNRGLLKILDEEIGLLISDGGSMCLVGCMLDFDEIDWIKTSGGFTFEKLVVPIDLDDDRALVRALHWNYNNTLLYWGEHMDLASITLPYHSLSREVAHYRGCLPMEAVHALKSVAEGYDDVAEKDQFKWTAIHGPLSDRYHVSWENENAIVTRKAILRVYNYTVAEDFSFNREDEIAMSNFMEDLGEAPRRIMQFNRGRIEAFLELMPLSPSDLLKSPISQLFARKLYQYHNLNISGSKHIRLWNRLRDWLGTAKQLCPEKVAKKLKLHNLEGEVIDLEHQFSGFQHLVGFCHCDLRCCNIMQQVSATRITLMGYELSSYNPIGFDIADYFWQMTVDNDANELLKSKYPGTEERRAFLKLYLSSKGSRPRQSEVEDLLREVDTFTPLSHLYRGLWYIIYHYAKHPEMHYLTYGRMRLDWYWESSKAAAA